MGRKIGFGYDSEYELWDDDFWNDDYSKKSNKKSSSSSYYSGSGWFKSSFSFKKDDPRQCIKNGFGYSSSTLKNYINTLQLSRAKEVVDLLEKQDLDYCIEDIFQLYYEEKRDFNISENNEDWYSQLIKFDNYLIRQFSVNNKSYSYILTAYILENVLSQLVQKTPEGDSKKINDPASSSLNQNLIDDAQNKAQGKSKQIEDLASEMGIGLDSSSALEDIKIFSENGIMMNVSNIRKFFKKMFGKKGFIKTTTEDMETSVDEIEFARDIGDLVEMETLATDFPVFDVFTKTGAKIKFDIYVDVSGSMDMQDITLPDRNVVSRMSMAKVIAIKMMKLGILNDIYTFDECVRQKNLKHPKEIKMTGGGTSYDSVIKHRKDSKKTSRYLILSDGDDIHSSFDKNCFTMIIARNSYLMSHCKSIAKSSTQTPVRSYLESNNLMFYNGIKIGGIKDEFSK